MPQSGHFSCIFLSISLAIPFFVGIVVLKKQEAQHDNDKQATRILWCAGGTLWQPKSPKRNLGRDGQTPGANLPRKVRR